MNYEHAYHVGSLSDVVKHVVLLELLTSLQKKPGGIDYMETHAAQALYDLSLSKTLKTKEFEQGIGKLWSLSGPLHPSIDRYLNIVKLYNKEKLHFYPGSALLAKHFLREQDNAILCEIHLPIYEKLYQFFKHDKHIHVHHQEGYQTLLSLLPPKTGRGLVFIDPPYEANNEWVNIIQNLEKMHKRWRQGTYAVWYPVKDNVTLHAFYKKVKKLPFTQILNVTVEDKVLPENTLRGCGLLIINPPWKLENTLKNLLPKLAHYFTLSQPHIDIAWLKQEENK